MGTGEPRDKANQDYASRSKEPLEVAPSETTFVFVTPHPWAGGKQWQNEKRSEGVWKDVRVLDVVDIETWLEAAPAVARWLADEMQHPLDGFRDVNGFVREEITARFGRPVPPSLLIGGREDAATTLKKWIGGNEREVRVQGESGSEAAMFTAAVLNSLSKEEQEAIASRVVFMDKPVSADWFTLAPIAHIIVPTNDEVKRKLKALDSPAIRLIVPEPQRNADPIPETRCIQLGPVQRASCEETLKNMGLEPVRVRRIAKESRGSLNAVLWMLDREGDQQLPWTQGAAAKSLLPLLLAGQWAADSPQDQQAIEKLAGRKYSDIESTLAEWSSPRGPLVRRGPTWDWLALGYAWQCLAPIIDHGTVDRFRQVALEVLGAPDPKFAMPAKDRWLANIYKKTHPWSSHLRAGLVGSLVQLALHSQGMKGMDGQTIAHVLVRDLLDGKMLPTRDAWLSLAPWLPDLAEAAPDAFIECVDGLLKDSSAVQAMFEERGMFGGSEHTHLLWALERLAWSPDYLTRVVLDLGALAAIDPGGSMANRPKASLKEILCAWHPGTMASPSQKLDALDVLRARYPKEAWELVLVLLPSQTDMAHGPVEPGWRDWKPETDMRVTVKDYWEYVEALVKRLLEWTDASGKDWVEILERWHALRLRAPDLAGRVLAGLVNTDAGALSDRERAQVCAGLRHVMDYFRRGEKDRERLSDEEFATLGELYSRFQPQDLLTRHEWLFSPHAELPTGPMPYSPEGQEALAAERKCVVAEVHRALGANGVLALAKTAQLAGAIGWALAETNVLSFGEDVALLSQALAAGPAVNDVAGPLQMGMGYVSACRSTRGDEWSNRLERDDRMAWTPNKRANFALALPTCAETWQRVAAWGTETENAYWSRVQVWPWGLTDASKDGEAAIRHLLRAKRPYAALELATRLVCKELRGNGKEAVALPTELLVQVLSVAPSCDPKQEHFRDSLSGIAYYLSETLDFLEQSGVSESELALIEWGWLPALEHTKHGMKALQESLSTNPSLFIDFLKLLYRGKDESEDPSNEENRKGAAHQAYALLHSWNRIPGTGGVTYPHKVAEGDVDFPQGEMSADKLREWIKEARRLAEECGRLGVCDSHIGQVLAHAPKDKDGSWPCREVRDVIEELASEDIESGLYVGVCNRRGIHSREKGGAQERRLAGKFKGYAEAVRSRWPRTAHVLNQIADGYMRESRTNAERDSFEEFER